jgi:hypothetical protein
LTEQHIEDKEKPLTVEGNRSDLDLFFERLNLKFESQYLKFLGGFEVCEECAIAKVHQQNVTQL